MSGCEEQLAWPEALAVIALITAVAFMFWVLFR